MLVRSFFLCVVEVNIFSSEMTLLGMTGVDSEPSSWHHFQITKLAPPEHKQVLLIAADALVDKHVDLSFDEPDEQGDSSACMIMHCDGVVEYASEVSTLGLLLMEFDDAIRGGDRDCRC